MVVLREPILAAKDVDPSLSTIFAANADAGGQDAPDHNVDPITGQATETKLKEGLNIDEEEDKGKGKAEDINDNPLAPDSTAEEIWTAPAEKHMEIHNEVLPLLRQAWELKKQDPEATRTFSKSPRKPEWDTIAASVLSKSTAIDTFNDTNKLGPMYGRITLNDLGQAWDLDDENKKNATMTYMWPKGWTEGLFEQVTASSYPTQEAWEQHQQKKRREREQRAADPSTPTSERSRAGSRSSSRSASPASSDTSYSDDDHRRSTRRNHAASSQALVPYARWDGKVMINLVSHNVAATVQAGCTEDGHDIVACSRMGNEEISHSYVVKRDDGMHYFVPESDAGGPAAFQGVLEYNEKHRRNPDKYPRTILPMIAGIHALKEKTNKLKGNEFQRKYDWGLAWVAMPLTMPKRPKTHPPTYVCLWWKGKKGREGSEIDERTVVSASVLKSYVGASRGEKIMSRSMSRNKAYKSRWDVLQGDLGIRPLMMDIAQLELNSQLEALTLHPGHTTSPSDLDLGRPRRSTHRHSSPVVETEEYPRREKRKKHDSKTKAQDSDLMDVDLPTTSRNGKSRRSREHKRRGGQDESGTIARSSRTS